MKEFHDQELEKSVLFSIYLVQSIAHDLFFGFVISIMSFFGLPLLFFEVSKHLPLWLMFLFLKLFFFVRLCFFIPQINVIFITLLIFHILMLDMKKSKIFSKILHSLIQIVFTICFFFLYIQTIYVLQNPILPIRKGSSSIIKNTKKDLSKYKASEIQFISF